jgi:prepilin-type N-terminal cleavage/methylation domain-containing protein
MEAARRHVRGFSLLELVVVVVAVAIFTAVALQRLLPLIGRAQRAAFLDVQRELQSSLFLEAAERITRGEAATIPALAAANPMSLLLKPPGNYVGVIEWSEGADIPRAAWYFDEKSGRLVYRVGRYTRFTAQEGPPELIELRVAFVYQDRDADGAFDAAGDRFDGLRLEPVHAYQWPD